MLETIARTYTGSASTRTPSGSCGPRWTCVADGGAADRRRRRHDGAPRGVPALPEQVRRGDRISREELAIRRRLHGGEDGKSAGAMDNLAAALLRKGEFPEAEKLTADSLRIRRRI